MNFCWLYFLYIYFSLILAVQAGVDAEKKKEKKSNEIFCVRVFFTEAEFLDETKACGFGCNLSLNGIFLDEKFTIASLFLVQRPQISV